MWECQGQGYTSLGETSQEAYDDWIVGYTRANGKAPDKPITKQQIDELNQKLELMNEHAQSAGPFSSADDISCHNLISAQVSTIRPMGVNMVEGGFSYIDSYGRRLYR